MSTTTATGLDVALRVGGRLDVALSAEPGDVVAVIGPNGAGKSTLLHALAGLLPASGHARLDGRDLMGTPARERGIGMVFQDRLLFPHLTAVDNVAFGPRSRGVPRREAESTARAWLERLGIGELAARRPGALSGGQAQRVAIARALATGPRLLLLDEPMAGLDVGVATALRIELAAHLRSYDGVALLVTHDALDALTLATRVLVVDGGRVAQAGTPDEVAQRPATDHVARLVGLNVVRDGRLTRAFAPAAVTVGLTPPEGSARHRWPGEVRGIAPHGDALRVVVRTQEGRDLIADVTPAAAAELGLVPGRLVWLSVKETSVSTYAERPR
jgi:molybdate transport system ATP-binding protein